MPAMAAAHAHAQAGLPELTEYYRMVMGAQAQATAARAQARARLEQHLVRQRLAAAVPSTVQLEGATWRAVGLNDWWRLSKYYPGSRFRAHVDARALLTRQNPWATRS